MVSRRIVTGLDRRLGRLRPEFAKDVVVQTRRSHGILHAVATPFCGLVEVEVPVVLAPSGAWDAVELAAAISSQSAALVHGVAAAAEIVRRLIVEARVAAVSAQSAVGG